MQVDKVLQHPEQHQQQERQNNGYGNGSKAAQSVGEEKKHIDVSFTFKIALRCLVAGMCCKNSDTSLAMSHTLFAPPRDARGLPPPSIAIVSPAGWETDADKALGTAPRSL